VYIVTTGLPSLPHRVAIAYSVATVTRYVINNVPNDALKFGHGKVLWDEKLGLIETRKILLSAVFLDDQLAQTGTVITVLVVIRISKPFSNMVFANVLFHM